MEFVVPISIIIMIYFIAYGSYAAGLKEGYLKAHKELKKD